MIKIRLILVSLLIFTMACAVTDLLKDDPTPDPKPPTAIANDDDPDDPKTSRPGSSGAVDALEDVRGAVIQIVADGTFISPEGIQSTTSGAGSGFIIDPSGIAVTNNHVVAGAGKLTVYIGGDTSKTYNAQLLGLSECSDLAVIDIEGDGFAYLEWYEGDIAPGLDVYAAGFPLGDPEYTLTRGIVSKARANGETDWASIDAVLEHDSTINPGNSGGPLVSADGKVVGVNYASSPNYNQYFAIAPLEALPVIEKLREGKNVDSLGINAQAIYTDDGLYGIWAISVQPGSRADQTGIQGGDILLTLQDLDLAEDGTMATYCDVIRSHTEDATLNVEVLRYASQEVLAGQINGRGLEQSFSFANEGGDDVQSSADSGSATYSDYVAVYDDYGVIGMEVPASWDSVDGSPWLNDDGSILGASIYAEPSQGDSEPWVFFAAIPITPGSFDADTLLDISSFTEECTTYVGRDTYSDILYTGKYDYYTGCYNDNSVIFVVAAEPEDGSFVTLVMANAVTTADLDAVDNVFDTFEVLGELPGADAVDPGGNATGASLTVFNNAPDDVAWLYVAPSESDTWGDDRLGDSVLSPGESITISGLTPGYYDIRPKGYDEIGMGVMYSVYVDTNVTVYVPGLEAIPDNAVLLLEEYFQDNSNDWYTDNSAEITVDSPSGGYYCFDINQNNYYVYSSISDPVNPTAAFLKETSFMMEGYCESSLDGACTMAFIPDTQTSDLIMFEVSSETQQYAITMKVNGEWIDNPVDWTYSPFIDPLYGNYLAVHRQNGYMSVFVNGVYIDQLNTSQYGAGQLGIAGNAYDNSDTVSICYSELTVWRLP